MKFRTSISQTKNGQHLIRGKNLVELIKNHSFTEVMFLFLRGNFPAEHENKLMDAMLVAASENGIEAPSLFVPRIVAASGNDFHTALAAGMLAIGEKHGGAAETAAEIFSSGKTAEEILEKYKVIPGFGHKIYKNGDPRTNALYTKAKELGFSCKYFGVAYGIEKALVEKKGKKLPLNIDGALACCMLELGLDPKLGKAVFLIARIPAMSGHILEE